MPKPLDKRHPDLMDGRLIEKPPFTSGSGDVRMTLLAALYDWNAIRRLGHVLIGVGYVLRRAPDTVPRA